MNKLVALVQELRLNEESAIKALKQWAKWQLAKKKAQQAYYKKNKEKLDKYHAEYRAKNPRYRARIAEKSRRRN